MIAAGRAFLVAIALLGAFSAAAYALFTCGEVVVVDVGSIDSSRGRDLTMRGWLPKHLPSDARNVHVAYDIDTGSHCGSFEYTLGWEPKGIAVRDTTEPPRICKNLPKWPRILPSQRIAQSESSSRGIVVVKTPEGRGYFWGPP